MPVYPNVHSSAESSSVRGRGADEEPEGRGQQERASGEGEPEGVNADESGPKEGGESVRPKEGSESNEEESGQARRERIKKVPKPPNATEQRIHRATHCPFRSWCPKCVAGRAHRSDHVTAEEFPNSVPQISFDYCFLRRGGSGDVSVPVVVGKVRRMGYIMAHVVPYRGGNQDMVVSKIVKDFELLGFNGQIVLKSDQEPALEYLLKEIAKARGMHSQ